MNKRYYPPLALFILVTLACNLPSLTATHQESTQVVSTEQQADINATVFAQEATATAFMRGADATLYAQSANATGTAMSSNALATAQAANATAQAGSANATSLALAASATELARASSATAQAYFPTLPPPPLPPSGAMNRITFPSGATSTEVAGLLQKNQAIDYALRALQGQTMIVIVSSPGNNVFLGVTGLSDGGSLLRPVAGATQFTGVLPITQDYRLTVVSPYQKSSFDMQVIVPVRIRFQPGGISATEQGRIIGGSINHYLLKAMAGQTITVNIFSPNDDILLTIYGISDGSPLVRSVSGATSWTGILPGTQDYMIEAVSVGGTTHYTLQVIVQ